MFPILDEVRVSLRHVGRYVSDDARHDEDRDAPVERVGDEGMTEIVATIRLE